MDFFRPKEVKWALASLDAYAHSDTELSHVALLEGVRTQIRDTKKTVASIREDKQSPEQLVALLITNVAWALLSSGNYHVYRGLLSNQGFQLLDVFDRYSLKLALLGGHSPEESEAEQLAIRSEISEVG